MRSIQSQLRDLAKNSNVDMETVVKKSLFRVFSSAESMSPVDKGHFKRSWIAAFGSPNEDVNNSGSGDSIGQLNIMMGSFKLGEIFYFTNNQPYAVRLEYGLSDQARSGMVRVSARNFPSIVDDETRKAKR